MQESFEVSIVSLYQLKQDAAEYVLSIPHERWATFAMPKRRFGH
jgi:hypothetical protein